MADQYPTLSFENKQEPLLPQQNHQFDPQMPPAPPMPEQNVYGQPPTGFAPTYNPPQGYGMPPQIPPQLADDDLEVPFKIKGVVELQKEFNAEEVKIVKKQPHILSLLLNILQGASRAFLIVVFIGYQTNRSAWSDQARLVGEIWFVFVLVEIIVLIEFFCSSTLRYLWNKASNDSIKDYVVKMKETRPSISMWCECYHFETRVRYVTETYTVQGSRGPETRTRQRMETYQEKVVTYTETEYYDYSHFFEISRMISDDIYHNDLIKIKFSQKIEFGDPYTRASYDRQLGRFVSRNKHRDVCFSYTENKQIPGFKERMFSINGEEHSCLVHWFWFTFLSLLGFTWPFRIWIESKCVRGEFNFHSVVFRDPSKFGY